MTEWFRQKEEGERVLGADEAVAAIRGQSDALMTLADEARPGRY